MTMFNDYLKLNKLGVVVIGILIAVDLVCEFILVIIHRINQVHPLGFDHTLINILSRAIPAFTMIITLAIVGLLFALALKTVIGRNRNLLLMYRMRGYYLKFQLAIISCSAVISGLLISMWILSNSLTNAMFEAGRAGITAWPSLQVVTQGVHPLIIVSIFCGYISVYYLVVYTIDIFANTSNRYNSISVRNLVVGRFLVRAGLIGLFSMLLYLSPEQYRLSYSSPYRSLIVINSSYIQGFLGLVVIMLMIVIIVDYMCYFKKKVIV